MRAGQKIFTRSCYVLIPMITLSTQPQHKMVIAHMSGLMTIAEIDQFERDKESAILSMGCAPNDYVLLVNTADCVIQTQQVVAAFQNLVANSPTKSKRVAIVQASSLARMQAQRVMIRDAAKIVRSEEEGVAWLLSQESA
ncbi:hypothetical protein [Sphingobium sp.]|uniref:hypothetical protein n=1 Tax=Sphingobium sp. TaxID=1912891 RepID=UPI003BB517E7